jgi:hypothetical protein
MILWLSSINLWLSSRSFFASAVVARDYLGAAET